MLRKKHHDVSWLEFELFQECPHLIHASFLRHGGVSEAPFSSLNVGIGLQDNEHNVKTNIKRCTHSLSKMPLALITGEQVHGKTVTIVGKQSPHKILGTDSLITRERNLALMVRHADCQAAIFHDPIKKLLACVHSGWRGSTRNIYKETIYVLTHYFGAKRENILVGVSPSLGPKSAEFVNYREELPESFWKYQVSPFHFDFWAITRAQLEEEGILPNHIQIAEVDTFQNNEDFFSYRREKITGRNGTIAFLH